MLWENFFAKGNKKAHPTNQMSFFYKELKL